jgi:hypothetical protein
MAINRLIPILALWGLADAACALPLTLLVDVPQSAPHHSPPAQNCLISTRTCESLSKVPASLCLVGTRRCLRHGKLVAVSRAPPRK